MNCLFCNKGIKEGRKFCSNVCYYNAVKAKIYPCGRGNKIGIEIVKCLNCDKLFEVKRGTGRKFCSMLCSQNRKVWNVGLTKETDERVFRSAQNHSITIRNRVLEGKWVRKFKKKNSFICLECENYFLSRKKSRKFCSIKCYQQFVKEGKDIRRKNVSNIWGDFSDKRKGEICQALSESRKRYLSNGGVSGMKGKKHTEITKDIISSFSLAFWKDPEYAKKMFKTFGVKPNKKEIFLNEILQKEFPNEWKFVGDGYTWIAGKCPDYLNVNGKKLVIELLGCYWHGCKIHYPRSKYENDEKELIDHYKRYGFDCLIIWEHDLSNLNLIKNKINGVVNC